ncbi:hypothetical protein [Rhodopirellula baltica]|uniref:hypothetical protein n=1 Tax=Rhodopirellula baltica TaxID=265606 RepID=UPI0002F1A1CF|nr:hypothetical protein [Rhodopirellula baltica]
MMSLSIRDLTIEDGSEAVELNEAVVALTSPMDAVRYATLCFHTLTGFIPVGTRQLDSGKTVSMQIRSLVE